MPEINYSPDCLAVFVDRWCKARTVSFRMDGLSGLEMAWEFEDAARDAMNEALWMVGANRKAVVSTVKTVFRHERKRERAGLERRPVWQMLHWEKYRLSWHWDSERRLDNRYWNRTGRKKNWIED